MMVTKQEMEKVHQEEVNLLNDQIEERENKEKNLEEELLSQQKLLDKIRELENDKLRFKADSEILESKTERLELENKRFKEEYDFKHSQ